MSVRVEATHSPYFRGLSAGGWVARHAARAASRADLLPLTPFLCSETHSRNSDEPGSAPLRWQMTPYAFPEGWAFSFGVVGSAWPTANAGIASATASGPARAGRDSFTASSLSSSALERIKQREVVRTREPRPLRAAPTAIRLVTAHRVAASSFSPATAPSLQALSGFASRSSEGTVI